MINDKIELLILRSLLHNENYARKILPFVIDEYFQDNNERIVFKYIKKFIQDFNSLPTREAILIQINKHETLLGEQYKTISDLVDSLDGSTPLPDEAFLTIETEKFCKERAVFNALYSSIKIIEGKEQNLDKGTIPKLLSDALAVSFDRNIGHSYTQDYEQRYHNMHLKEEKLAFDLKYMNKITNGGITKKTLNVILAGTGVGKSLCLCHFAASYLISGKNVLYITLEMSEKKIAERLDANLLNSSINEELHRMSEDTYANKIATLLKKTTGELIIREFPTATANVMHFRSLLNELALKKNFVPDVIIVDYLNLATSSRLKTNANVNSYTYVKSIAEEMRGLAVEYDVPIWTATQVNRQGFSSSDINLENTSESFGLPATADLMLAISQPEEFEKMNRYLIKQLKNRYSDLTKMKRFIIGVDKSKMKLYDVEESAQEDLMENMNGKRTKDEEKDTPLFDKTKFGQADNKTNKLRGFKYDD